jgi:hypothetical protein
VEIGIGRNRRNERVAMIETGIKEAHIGCAVARQVDALDEVVNPGLLFYGGHVHEEVGRGLGQAQLGDGAQKIVGPREIMAFGVNEDDGPVDELDRLSADPEA